MQDPYSVLGVSPEATDEEIKTAYRNLAKKYHPDHYTDTPLADLASEKMKEINEAYELLMKQRKNGQSYSGNAQGGYTYSYSNGASSFGEVRSLIMQGRIAEAEHILDNTEMGSRNAEWFFLKGSIQYSRGFLEQAFYNVQTACNMEPNNIEYQSMLNRMNSERNGSYVGYNQTNNTVSGNSSPSCNGCDMCQCLICSDCCCECMGGDLIRCC